MKLKDWTDKEQKMLLACLQLKMNHKEIQTYFPDRTISQIKYYMRSIKVNRLMFDPDLRKPAFGRAITGDNWRAHCEAASAEYHKKMIAFYNNTLRRRRNEQRKLNTKSA